jgi:hypothetical protein
VRKVALLLFPPERLLPPDAVATTNTTHRVERVPSRAALWRKWKQYREEGFDALLGEMVTLDKLNETFIAWLEMSYHQRIHAATRQSPDRDAKSIWRTADRGVRPETGADNAATRRAP